MDNCEVCHAQVRELRRGRCWGCYSRWVEARPVGLGAACRLCGERRRAYLKSVELLGSWAAVCHNCAARASTLVPVPRSLGGIREALGRERRQLPRRSGVGGGQVDPAERRATERRATGGAAAEDGSGPVGLATGTGVPRGGSARSLRNWTAGIQDEATDTPDQDAARPAVENQASESVPLVDDAMILEIEELVGDLAALAEELPGRAEEVRDVGDWTRIHDPA